MTSHGTPEDQPKNEDHFVRLRDYEARLGTWVGLNSGEVIRLIEVPTGQTTPADRPGLRIEWSAGRPQHTTKGTASGLGMMQATTKAEASHYFGAVQLDWQELREMRAEVGDRPERESERYERKVREAHQLNSHTGNCRCGWEMTSTRRPKDEHEAHVQRVLVGKEPPAGTRGRY